LKIFLLWSSLSCTARQRDSNRRLGLVLGFPESTWSQQWPGSSEPAAKNKRSQVREEIDMDLGRLNPTIVPWPWLCISD